ncbi:fibrinogen-like protein 1 [Branchiostoma lanceolatum]|uniref:fibrinogen-like protein 1 n=1 Tax=Branchiostoma lanceolatum TaxID=7740 RepID=UPI003452276A
MDTAGGGWTVIQRRQDGSVPFNRNWEEYKQGFGDVNGEYWLGNDNIHLLTQEKNYTLRIDMMGWDNQTRFAEYSTFRVSDELDQYKLYISGYAGNAGDSLFYLQVGSNIGHRFSTVDRDNDYTDYNHCSQLHGQAGWWYRGCTAAVLNGHYLGNCGTSCPRYQGVVWNHWRGPNYSLKSVSMKIRPTEELQVTTETPQVTTAEPQVTTAEPQVTTAEPQVTTEVTPVAVTPAPPAGESEYLRVLMLHLLGLTGLTSQLCLADQGTEWQ